MYTGIYSMCEWVTFLFMLDRISWNSYLGLTMGANMETLIDHVAPGTNYAINEGT